MRWSTAYRRAAQFVLAAVLAACCGSVEAAYQLRYTRHESGGCDFRVGWHVAAIGDRLFAGGPWDQVDCGVYGYGLLVYDLATGSFEQSLPGTYAAVSAGSTLLLGHVDGVQRVDATTLAVEQTLVGPNQDHPWLALHGAVAADVLAVGLGDTPETADLQVVFRIAPASGTVVQRYIVPHITSVSPPLDAAAGNGVVAVGRFERDSPSGVFVFGADDGELRWSAVTPRGGYSERVGRAVAVAGDRLLVGVPSVDPAQPRGRVLVFALQTGASVDELEAPEPAAGFDFFGRAVAAAGNLVVIGARGIGADPTPGRAFVYDAEELHLVDVLSAASEIPMGDAVAIAGDIIVVGGNENDGVIHVFEPSPPTTITTTTTTTLPACGLTCDDGDACTVDTCVDGECHSTSLPDFEGIRCRLDALRRHTACAPLRIARRLDARLRRLATLAEKAAQPPASARANRRFVTHFLAYCKSIERLRGHGSLPSACADGLAIGCTRAVVY